MTPVAEHGNASYVAFAFSSLASTSALKQTIRVAAACAVAYAAYKLLDLQQGYWAVFTVLIVMQGSIGGTLGAASIACWARSWERVSAPSVPGHMTAA